MLTVPIASTDHFDLVVSTFIQEFEYLPVCVSVMELSQLGVSWTPSAPLICQIFHGKPSEHWNIWHFPLEAPEELNVQFDFRTEEETLKVRYRWRWLWSIRRVAFIEVEQIYPSQSHHKKEGEENWDKKWFNQTRSRQWQARKLWVVGGGGP